MSAMSDETAGAEQAGSSDDGGKTGRLDAALERFGVLLGAAGLHEHRVQIERAPRIERDVPLEEARTRLLEEAADLHDGETAADLERALRFDLLALAAVWLRIAANEGPEQAERLATIASALLDTVPTLATSPFRAVELPWIWGRPGASVVSAHAAAHPLEPGTGRGLWLAVDDAIPGGWPQLVALGAVGISVFEIDAPGVQPLGLGLWARTSRFLPLSAAGIPTCFLYPAPAVDPESKPIRHVDTEEALGVARALVASDENAARVIEAVVRERDYHLGRVGELLAANTAAKMRCRAIAALVPEVRCHVDACGWKGSVGQTGTRGDALTCPRCGAGRPS